MKKLKSLESFEESGYAIQSRAAQRAIIGGFTVFVSNCGTPQADYEQDTENEEPPMQ